MTLMATLFIQARAPTCHSSFFSTRNLESVETVEATRRRVRKDLGLSGQRLAHWLPL
ncbi:unnamed protein product [Arabidopsis thaliana]|uniref:(thale cress) hypothetical protein n=1 Tax=Arabidopsis thaliana TaxID=3702 RepID=A0A7G2EEC7_ARATH|nr:unnamed protein product [Arabidopsis thaliana]